MSEIAFIGVGTMGAPMAALLVKAGHRVRCYSRTATTREAVRDFGGRPADSVLDAVSGADLTITMLPDSPDVRSVALGKEGILAGLAGSAGAAWVDMSTIDPGVARELHQAAAERGIAMLDAPVSGGEIAAKEGTLSVMVGGDASVLTSVRPALDVLSRVVVHVGPAGSGQVAKAANQLIVAGNLALLGEALTFLRRHGADVGRVFEALGQGLAGSTVMERRGASMLAADYTPGFRVELHDKDLRIVQRAAQDNGLSLPVTAVVAQLMAALKARGDGKLDHTALAKLVAELNGADEKSAQEGE
ncbi:NAD(P)-dependent oxidoreductase [Actinopolymorpha alba]|uniref:NAD(P)-dependent oxidoreductase n=1 Tax=Actinopolymorpha alba TaxID=533267 RepID=UPI000367842F|nr:NAD(P)-dependent oxidoreductase [Actinopolymorpha alba]